MHKTLTAPEFLQKLGMGTLRTPLIREGFAKPVGDRHGSHESHESHGSFLFSSGTSCHRWTEIPGEVVEKVEFLGEHSCRDHSHPLVRIHFKEPAANDRYATVLFDLLQAANPGPVIPPSLFLAPFTGEWRARLDADAVWYGGGDGGGGVIPALPPGGAFPADFDYPGSQRCRDLRRACAQGNRGACRRFLDECG